MNFQKPLAALLCAVLIGTSFPVHVFAQARGRGKSSLSGGQNRGIAGLSSRDQIQLTTELGNVLSQLPSWNSSSLVLTGGEDAHGFNPHAAVTQIAAHISQPQATALQIAAGQAILGSLSNPKEFLPELLRDLRAITPEHNPVAGRQTAEALSRWIQGYQKAASADSLNLNTFAHLKLNIPTSPSALFDGALVRSPNAPTPASVRTTFRPRSKPSGLQPANSKSKRLKKIPAVEPPVSEFNRQLPFAAKRSFSLSRTAALMERRLASGGAMTEEDYRDINADTFFASRETRRMDTLLSRQAADPAQAILEVISNAQDASTPGKKKVGRFGVGGLQILGELQEPGDRVLLESSMGDGQTAQFIFWKKDGEVYYDYQMISGRRQGTRFRVFKNFSPVELRRRKNFLETKLRANDRGPVVWKSGETLNRPDSFLEWGAARPQHAKVKAVKISLDSSGYEVEDFGSGMGLKVIFERYLKPYGTDKPVSATRQAARLLYRENEDTPQASLGVSMVEIEGLVFPSRLNLARDVFIDLPHDTDLTEDRGLISLVSGDQKISGALRGMKLLIDRLTDPKIEGPNRFALINSVAAIIRDKQPASEKGMSRGDPKTATDLLWYLRHRLQASRLLESYRKNGTGFFPNAPRWAPLDGVSDNIILLDEALFSPDPRDYAAGELEALPASLTEQAAFSALKARSSAEYFMRPLKPGEALVIVDGDVVVIDKALAQVTGKAEVLAARIDRELRKAAVSRETKSKSSLSRFARYLRPILLAAAVAAVSLLLYTQIPSGLSWSNGSDAWTERHSISTQMSGHWDPASPKKIRDGKDLKPEKPFGKVSPHEGVNGYFIDAIKAKLTTMGSWSYEEAAWSRPTSSEGTGPKIEVSYQVRLIPRFGQRLFNQANGRITEVTLQDAEGNPVKYSFNSLTDNLKVKNFVASARVSYQMVLGQRINGLEAEEALPANELRDFPQQWREVLDPVKNASDGQKRAAIEFLMARDFVYDYSKAYFRDGISWTHTAQRFLNSKIPIPIICNTSSLYYYLMARYLDLPAAYVTLTNSEKGIFYHDLVGHAKVMVKIDSDWHLIETTSLMPLKVGAPRVISGSEGSGGASGSRFWPSSLTHNNLSSAKKNSEVSVFAQVIMGFIGTLIASTMIVAVLGHIRRRRVLQPLRRSFTQFGGRGRSLPRAWMPWSDLAQKDGLTRVRTPSGTLYKIQSETIYAANKFGELQRLDPSGETQRTGRNFTFVTFWGHIKTFDGSTVRTIFRNFALLHNSKLLSPLGPRRYALHNERLLRLDTQSASFSEVTKLVGPLDVKQIESQNGVDRFVTMRWAGWGKRQLRSFSVSGDKVTWEKAELIINYKGWTLNNWKIWKVDEALVVQSLEVQESVGKAFLNVSGQEKIPLPGDIEAVLDGKVFVAVGSDMKAFDVGLQQWVKPTLGDITVLVVKKVGEDIFLVYGEKKEGNSTFFPEFFADPDGREIAPVRGSPDVAVRHGDVVYYRGNSDRVLYTAAKNAPEQRISLKHNPEQLFSDAAARATGLDASLFIPLNAGWEKYRGGLLDTLKMGSILDEKEKVDEDYEGYKKRAQQIFYEAAEADQAFINKLKPELKAAGPFRMAGMSKWSLARFFVSPDGARKLPFDTGRMDQLVRDNIENQDWLLEAFELIDRVYRFKLEKAPTIVKHYLDIIEAAPEILSDLREAILEPVLLNGVRTEPLAYLNAYDPKAVATLPLVTQLYLQMLKNGPESLLRREADNAPKGTAVFALEKNQSLSRIIAAASTISEAELDRGGLEEFARALDGLAPDERADLSAVQGIVRSQGLTLPVWIRELVQNARDAVREARRQGRRVPLEVKLRSFLSKDGSRWIVSVGDGVGMKLSRFLKSMLVPEATTKTLADEVRGFLEISATVEEKIEHLFSEFFDDAARKDGALLAFLREALKQENSVAAARIADAWSERMKKGGAGFFGMGFFTVFGGADEVVIRTEIDGLMHEAALIPIRDDTGALIDIEKRWLRAYEDKSGKHAGTEVLRIKNVTSQNLGRVLIENAYVHIMANKFLGGVSDVAIGLNEESLSDNLETVGERDGIRSRMGPFARPRWTVDELFVSEAPKEGLSLIPPVIVSALQSAGWNVDFPAAVPVVRTRTSVQAPGRYAQTVAALALPAMYWLYRLGAFTPPGLPSYLDHRQISPWDSPRLPEDILQDAAAIRAGRDNKQLWEKYRASQWAQLMMAMHDDKEKALRKILGKKMSAELDEFRARGEPLRVGRLPREGNAGYEKAVRTLHRDALESAKEGAFGLENEAAALGLARVLARLASFMESPPEFVSADARMWEALRLYMDQGRAVPLLEAFLEASGRNSDFEAVSLFEAWLKDQAADTELEGLFLGQESRVEAEASLRKLSKAASRGRPILLTIR